MSIYDEFKLIDATDLFTVIEEMEHTASLQTDNEDWDDGYEHAVYGFVRLLKEVIDNAR